VGTAPAAACSPWHGAAARERDARHEDRHDEATRALDRRTLRSMRFLRLVSTLRDAAGTAAKDVEARNDRRAEAARNRRRPVKAARDDSRALYESDRKTYQRKVRSRRRRV